jgi:hypothetical protein
MAEPFGADDFGGLRTLGMAASIGRAAEARTKTLRSVSFTSGFPCQLLIC